MTTTLEPLTADEQDALAVCERRIANGIEAFRDVVFALKEVRDGRLYRHAHATFEDYCQSRWGFTRRRGYQLIEAAEAIASLPTECEQLFTNEGQARELAKVEPERRAEVVQKAADGGKLTAEAIRKAAKEPEPEETPEPVAPEDGETRAYRVSLKLKTIADAAKDGVASLNPTRAELIQAGLTFKRLGNELERAAAELPED